MTENVNLNTMGKFKLNDTGTFKIGKCEHTMFTSGDVFCSLTPEEMEAEREEARIRYEKWQELLLLERSSKMTLMDFFEEWQRWQKREEDDETYLDRVRHYDDEWKERWSEYKYRKDTYDREKADAIKIERWRKFHMVGDHVWIVSLLVIACLAWNDPAWKFCSYVAIILALLNIFMVAFRWTTYRKTNEWEVI
jgi:hypothetical protein